MPLKFFARVSLSICGMAISGFCVEIQWRLPFPSSAASSGEQTIFNRALEAKNGDFVISANDPFGYSMIRLNSIGEIRWLSRTDAGPSECNDPTGFFEVDQGIVVECSKDLEYYDITGKKRLLLHVEDYAIRSVATDGSVVFMEIRGDSAYQRLRKKNLEGEMAWSVPLDSSMINGNGPIRIHNLGESGALMCSFPNILKVNAKGETEWQYRLPRMERVSEAFTDTYVTYSQSFILPDKRIVLAGVVVFYRKNQQAEIAAESLYVTALEPDGRMTWSKAYDLGIVGKNGMAVLKHVGTIAASGDRGFAILLPISYQYSSSSPDDLFEVLEFNSDGSMAGLLGRFPGDIPFPANYYERIRYDPFMTSLIRDGKMVFWHESRDTLKTTTPIPGVYQPRWISYPSYIVFDAASKSGWREVRLDGFQDTVSVVEWGSNGGGGSNRTNEPHLALVGGQLWNRSGRDTTYFAALKLAPGYSLGVRQAGNAIQLGRRSPGISKEYSVLGRIQSIQGQNSGSNQRPRTWLVHK
jgi:hypothetical protein